MNILVFGASHTGAIKLGYESIRNELSSKFLVDFFAITSRLINEVKVDENQLILSDSAMENVIFSGSISGSQSINLRQYDWLVFVHEANLLSPQYLYSRSNSENETKPTPLSLSILKDISSRYEPTQIQKQNFGRFEQLKLGGIDLTTNLHFIFISQLFDIFLNRIAFVGRPLPSEHFRPEIYNINAQSVEIYQCNNDKIRQIADESWQSDVAIKHILPPREVLNESGFRTRHEFMRKSITSRGETASQTSPLMDLSHGNLYYGKTIAKEIFSKYLLEMI
jgi:hypothetical protein